jgi:hypothetical protein
MALNVGTRLGHYSVTVLIGEGVLEFAEHVLTDAARLWAELGIDGKQDLQQALFSQGLSLDGQKF